MHEKVDSSSTNLGAFYIGMVFSDKSRLAAGLFYARILEFDLRSSISRCSALMSVLVNPSPAP